MAISTYAELQTAVSNWLARDDLSAIIVDFISLAESRLWKELRTRDMVGRSTSSVSTQYTELPSDFIAQRSIKIGDNVLNYMTPERLEMSYASDQTGTPTAFTVIGNEYQFAPMPDTTYTVEISYYKRPAALSDTNTTSWLLTNSPELYLYGALLEAAPYLRDDARVQLWATGFSNALNRLNDSERDGRYGNAPVIWSQVSD